MQKSNNCLSYDRVLTLLPMEFKPMNIINSKQKLYQSPKGIILLKESQIYRPQNVLWSGVNKEMLLEKEVSFLCMTAGFMGILLIPVECLIQYIENNNVSTLKNGRTNLRIRTDEGRFVLYDTNAKELDLTNYFIQNEYNESFQDSI